MDHSSVRKIIAITFIALHLLVIAILCVIIAVMILAPMLGLAKVSLVNILGGIVIVLVTMLVAVFFVSQLRNKSLFSIDKEVVYYERTQFTIGRRAFVKNLSRFAETNHLKFIPGSFFRDSSISGTYGGFNLSVTLSYDTPKALEIKITPLVHSPKRLSKAEDITQKLTILKPSRSKIFITPDLSKYFKEFSVVSASPHGSELTLTNRFERIADDTRYLQMVINLLCDIAYVYPHIVWLGGEAVPELVTLALATNHPLNSIAIQLIRDISKDTTKRLASDSSKLLCLKCLSRRCGPQQVRLSIWTQSVTPIIYYGCTVCGQSRRFLKDKLIAVLDNEMTLDGTRQDRILRVNWLKQRRVFDFDEIEIIRATDKEVEHFAMKVGNDTDRKRRSRYQKIVCKVSTNCRLSENGVRILKRQFGEVKMTEHT